MKKFNKWSWLYRLGGAAASLAMMVTVLNVNSACTWFAYQPELPEEAQKLRKF